MIHMQFVEANTCSYTKNMFGRRTRVSRLVQKQIYERQDMMLYRAIQCRALFSHSSDKSAFSPLHHHTSIVRRRHSITW